MLWSNTRLTCCAICGLCTISVAGANGADAQSQASRQAYADSAVATASQDANTARDGNIAIREEDDMAVRQKAAAVCELPVSRQPSSPDAALARQNVSFIRGDTSDG